jgi:Putative zinc-binding metallo-peptidase
VTDAAAKPAWADLSDEALLELRFSDLGLTIAGTPLEAWAARLHAELEERGLVLRPPVYLGDEWFSPDAVPAIAMPFYLAHPRLEQLERRMMLDVEGGGSGDEIMRFLRHECGHAVAHGYRLTRRRDWRAVFGSPAKEFDDHYRFQPYSKNFVHHLENWYAQSHPEEDFAETFAVWLTPGLDWRGLYQGWPVSKKLVYVDRLMQSLRGVAPAVSDGERSYDVRRLRRRLRSHYAERRRLYAEDDPRFFDADLHRLFLEPGAAGGGEKASRFLRRERRRLRDLVSSWTRERKFTVDRLLQKLAARCDELGLRMPAETERVRLDLAAYLSALVSNYLFTGQFSRSP